MIGAAKPPTPAAPSRRNVPAAGDRALVANGRWRIRRCGKLVCPARLERATCCPEASRRPGRPPRPGGSPPSGDGRSSGGNGPSRGGAAGGRTPLCASARGGSVRPGRGPAPRAPRGSGSRRGGAGSPRSDSFGRSGSRTSAWRRTLPDDGWSHLSRRRAEPVRNGSLRASGRSEPDRVDRDKWPCRSIRRRRRRCTTGAAPGLPPPSRPIRAKRPTRSASPRTGRRIDGRSVPLGRADAPLEGGER